jgi:P27 family predicted phage terminase small subunit
VRPGAKPIPRNLRIVRGTKTNALPTLPAKPIDEPQVKVPLPPEDLGADEIDVFVAMARKLAGMRVMTDADVDAVVIYSRNWIDAKKARRHVEELGLVVKSPSGYPIMNPFLAIARKAEDRCIRILTEFGMTPSSRNRVSQ